MTNIKDARHIVNIEFTGNVYHAVVFMEQAVWIMPFGME